MACPPCTVYDKLLNVCIEPCSELGPSSRSCRLFGCADTTTAQTTTIVQSPVPAHVVGPIFEDAATNLPIIAVVGIAVVFMAIALLIVWRCRKRRQSSVNDTGRMMYILLLLFSVFIILIFCATWVKRGLPVLIVGLKVI